MNKQKEALQVALEAFEESGILWKMAKAHKAVKEALKEPSWVGLTDAEIDEIWKTHELPLKPSTPIYNFIDRVIDRLKEKNT